MGRIQDRGVAYESCVKGKGRGSLETSLEILTLNSKNVSLVHLISSERGKLESESLWSPVQRENEWGLRGL